MYIAFIACVHKLYIIGVRTAIMLIVDLGLCFRERVGSERHSSIFFILYFFIKLLQ